MYDKNMQELLDKLRVFDKMYEAVRFVDPMLKKTIDVSGNTFKKMDCECYQFLGKDSVCDNCISMRAHNLNKTFVKIELSKNGIYIITAVPVEMQGERIVVEFFKNITDSMIFMEGNKDYSAEIYSMIDNMNNLVMKDALTDIYNRRFVNEKLPVDMIASSIKEADLSVILTDIDYFKKVNDTYGHVIGDCVLKEFAHTLNGILLDKKESWVARYGGEEFLICLPDTSEEDALQIAEKMRKSIEDKIFYCGENHIKITSSFGICSLKAHPSKDMEGLIDCADKKLYLAKDNGRNRVEV